MSLRIKICGITKPEQARTIAQLGATALGFICVPGSPRYVNPETIATLVATLLGDDGNRCDRIGVFVNASLETIVETVTIADLSGVQLHGDESVEFCEQLRQRLPAIELIKALRVQTTELLEQVKPYETCVDTLLLDAYHPTLAGGTGKTLDWSGLQQFQPPVPWLLAGGLTPHNIHAALNQLRPAGIDLSSGVESAPGDKDLDKVAQLFANLQVMQHE